jgi:hypothetical protein
MAEGRKKIFQGKLTDIHSSDLEGIGTIRKEADKEYVYCKGVASVTAGCVVTISTDGNYTTALLTRALGAVPRKLGVAAAAIVASKYGWFQVKGYCGAILAGAACAADTQLYTDTGQDATGGVDDTSTSEHAIHGMVLGAAVPSSSPATAVGYLDYPWTAPTFD